MAPGMFKFVHREGAPQLDGTRDRPDAVKTSKTSGAIPKHLATRPGLAALLQRDEKEASESELHQPVHQQFVSDGVVEPVKNTFEASTLLDTNSTVASEHFVPQQDGRYNHPQLGNQQANYHDSAGHASDGDFLEPEFTSDVARRPRSYQHDFDGDHQSRPRAERHQGDSYRSGRPFEDHAFGGVLGLDVRIDAATHTKNHQAELNGDYRNRQQTERHSGGSHPAYPRSARPASGGGVPEPDVIVDAATRTEDHHSALNGDYRNKQQAESHQGNDRTKRTTNGTTKKSKNRAKLVAVEKLPVQEMNASKTTKPSHEGREQTNSRNELPSQHTPTVNTRVEADEYLPSPPSKRRHSQLDLDYEVAALYEMDFSELQNEPYDQDPSTTLPTLQELDELLDLSLTQQERHDNLRIMSAGHWQETGKWLIEHFADITRKLIHSRHDRRMISKEYEDEVARRHEDVVSTTEELTETLDEMKRQGQKMNEATPKSKSKKRGIVQP